MDFVEHLPTILAWAGSIITGLFTLLGVWFANRSNLRQLEAKLRHEIDKDRRDLHRARLEELYSLVDRWAGEMVIHHVTYRRVMDGQLTYNQALELTIANDATVDAARMFTLAELYFPSARAALDRLKVLRDEASSIQAEFKQLHRRSGDTSHQHAERLTHVLECFSVAVDEYQRALAAQAAEL